MHEKQQSVRLLHLVLACHFTLYCLYLAHYKVNISIFYLSIDEMTNQLIISEVAECVYSYFFF